MGDIYAAIELIMLLPGRRAGLVRSEAARLFVRFFGGDLAMAEQVIRNRERQERLAQDAPGHPGRAFGEAVEALGACSNGVAEPWQNAEVSQAVAQKICESVVQVAIPQLTQMALDIFAKEFDKFASRLLKDQAAWQTDALRQFQATLCDIRRDSARRAPSVQDATPVIDVEEHAPDASAFGSLPLKVGKFLESNWIKEWQKAGVDVKSYLLQFSMLLKARATKSRGRNLSR